MGLSDIYLAETCRYWSQVVKKKKTNVFSMEKDSAS